MSKIYVGLGVSLEMTSSCAVAEVGRVCLEARVSSDPDSNARAFGDLGEPFERVGFEAGPMSQWMYVGLIEAGYPAVCIEMQHAKAAMGSRA